ncbi:MAG: hypothetical protein BGO88_15575 [Flavobacterium sp. 38-13]|uniref:hypothetical protein n=1 Tax=Flavobacterium sp. 38-13 TaxID=1896168 RepID=UPI000962361C|nr:hypothetical protein [Flavobacterium sp. 38-13]OJX49650.1 MAG: hypothetical protein BGO88_15575 [Flavobacterium sp. 38-13]
MENSKKKKKKDRKPLFILFAFFAVFGLFIYLISIPSPEENAKKELITAYNKDAVKQVWEKYKLKLHDSESFLLAIRTKLSTMQLTDAEIKDCIGWLPPAPESLNIIVVPDLSNRIDLIPGQIDSDKKTMEAIWNAFESTCKLKKDSHDRLIVDVTDKHQAGGEFEKIANNLRFNLSDHKGKTNRLYFTQELSNQYRNAVNTMYVSAKGKELGADYYRYFRQYLESNLKKPNFFTKYKNKVIILTDGYIEPQDEKAYTKLYGYEKILYPVAKKGDLKDMINKINKHDFNIPSANIDLSNTEILVCEVTERKSGEGRDSIILEAYWKDWLYRMAAKDVVFYERQKASAATIETIKKFISS